VNRWIIAAVVLLAFIAGGIAALQMGLIPWPATTSEVDPAMASSASAPQQSSASNPAGGTDQTPNAAANLARRRTSLAWLEKTKCPQVPEVAWWKFVSHRSIARYVTRNLKGDWREYRRKWAARLENVEDILARESMAITGTGVSLSGDELIDYVAKMKIRVAVIDCLSQEADAFAKSR
jgi:hypothetical protein